MSLNMFLILLLIISAILYYHYLHKPNQHWKNLNVSYIKPWPFFGNMGPFLLRRISLPELFQNIYNSNSLRYIGTFSFTKPALLIQDVNLLKQLNVKDFDYFIDRRSMVSDDTIEPMISKNLVGLKGQDWRHMRATISPAFTGSKMRAMFMLMSECAGQFANYFAKNVKPEEALVVELREEFSRYSNDVIASCAFGINCDSLKDKNNDFFKMGQMITKFLTGFGLLRFFGYLLASKQMKFLGISFINPIISNYFANIVKSNIKEREEKGIIRPDMIHLLMEAKRGKLQHEEITADDDIGFATVQESNIVEQTQIKHKELTDDDIVANALIFFIAGFDTVAVVTSFFAYELAVNPDVQQKLQQEIDATYEKCDGKISYKSLQKMKYLDMVMSEVLRKWPPVPAVDRICLRTYTIQPETPAETSLTLEKDDLILIPIYAIHRDPKYFPNPEKFDPERFSDENKQNIVPGSYMPFGIGPRSCVASRFALMETKILIVHLLKQLSIVVVDKTDIPLQISCTQFNTAANSYWLGLKLRSTK